MFRMFGLFLVFCGGTEMWLLICLVGYFLNSLTAVYVCLPFVSYVDRRTLFILTLPVSLKCVFLEL